MRQCFRSWLRDHYYGDERALRSAWQKPDAAFATAEVPSEGEQLHIKNWTFRDPSQEQNVIDYFACYRSGHEWSRDALLTSSTSTATA